MCVRRHCDGFAHGCHDAGVSSLGWGQGAAVFQRKGWSPDRGLESYGVLGGAEIGIKCQSLSWSCPQSEAPTPKRKRLIPFITSDVLRALIPILIKFDPFYRGSRYDRCKALGWGSVLVTGGYNLRVLREKLGLTMRDIETASEEIARRRHNEEYSIPISRLSDFETKGVIPSIYRLYSLSVIYRKDFRELLAWYGVDLSLPVSDLEIATPPRSHLSNALVNNQLVQMPIRMDPAFDPRKTLNFGRMDVLHRSAAIRQRTVTADAIIRWLCW